MACQPNLRRGAHLRFQNQLVHLLWLSKPGHAHVCSATLVCRQLQLGPVGAGRAAAHPPIEPGHGSLWAPAQPSPLAHADRCHTPCRQLTFEPASELALGQEPQPLGQRLCRPRRTAACSGCVAEQRHRQRRATWGACANARMALDPPGLQGGPGEHQPRGLPAAPGSCRQAQFAAWGQDRCA